MTLQDAIVKTIAEHVNSGKDKSAVLFPARDNADWAMPEVPFNEVKNLPKETLHALGCRHFNTTKHGELWLFPGEWFAYLPPGLEITNIFGITGTFNPDTTDSDTRMGCLAFGVMLPNDPG